MEKVTELFGDPELKHIAVVSSSEKAFRLWLSEIKSDFSSFKFHCVLVQDGLRGINWTQIIVLNNLPSPANHEFCMRFYELHRDAERLAEHRGIPVTYQSKCAADELIITKPHKKARLIEPAPPTGA